jgi:hypothetical protein
MHGPITARIYDVAPGGLARHPDRLIERSDRLQEPLVRLLGCGLGRVRPTPIGRASGPPRAKARLPVRGMARQMRSGSAVYFACHLIRVACIIRHAMSKSAALRLAAYLRSLGHQVRLRQNKSRMGASFYSLEFLAPVRRAAHAARRAK